MDGENWRKAALMKTIPNPYRGAGIQHPDLAAMPYPSTDATTPRGLLQRCPAYGETPLVKADGLARDLGVGSLWIKDERGRMGLGSFKALGAAYVLAHRAAEKGGEDLSQALKGETYVTASAGNHGLSVAAGAAVFGAKGVVYLAETVPEAFAERLRAKGADVVREGAIYEDSMEAAKRAAEANGWVLLSDSSWPGYSALPHRLMEGYLAMASEAAEALEEPPTHVFLQAGVGGLAGAVAALVRNVWGDVPRIIVVEPENAPALQASIEAGRSVVAEGPASEMGRLDCKEPSLIALKGLSRDADDFQTISEAEGNAILAPLAAAGLETTASGAAGIAGLAEAARAGCFGDLSDARVLTFLSEGPE